MTDPEKYKTKRERGEKKTSGGLMAFPLNQLTRENIEDISRESGYISKREEIKRKYGKSAR